MATKTIYTARCRVPIYVSWRCPHCDSVNYSGGEISYVRQTQSASLRTQKQLEAKERAAALVESEWADHALDILLAPKNYTTALLDDTIIYDTKCNKCKKRPKWDKRKINRVIQLIQIILVVPAFVCALIGVCNLFGGKFDYKSLILIAVSLTVFLCKYIFQINYEKSFSAIPEKYMPVFSSLNEELQSAAVRRGKKLPSPDEVNTIVNSYEPSKSLETKDSPTSPLSDSSFADPVSEVSKNENELKVESILYCRKCGAQLQKDSEFCHKCGTQVIRNPL